MAKEYPLLYGYADDVQEELHNINEVADFIIKHGVNTYVTSTTPLDTLLLNTYGIYINNITDMEYREELLKMLVPKQQAVFDIFDVGGFECIGYCEIDKYARQAYESIYNTEGELYFEDATKIRAEDLPEIDLICGGFPCQSFSHAGKRKGFDDPRGTLFFEIARITAAKRPKYLLLENAPGLLNHNGGRTFATILNTLDELGYDVTWQVLNSKDYYSLYRLL